MFSSQFWVKTCKAPASGPGKTAVAAEINAQFFFTFEELFFCIKLPPNHLKTVYPIPFLNVQL